MDYSKQVDEPAALMSFLTDAYFKIGIFETVITGDVTTERQK